MIGKELRKIMIGLIVLHAKKREKYTLLMFRNIFQILKTKLLF